MSHPCSEAVTYVKQDAAVICVGGKRDDGA